MGIKKTLASLVLAGGLAFGVGAKDSQATLLHTNPNAYTIFEDEFDNGIMDGMQPWCSSNIYEANGYLVFPYDGIAIHRMSMPQKYEAQIKMDMAHTADQENMYFIEGNLDEIDTMSYGVHIYSENFEGYAARITGVSISTAQSEAGKRISRLLTSQQTGVDEFSFIRDSSLIEIYHNGDFLFSSDTVAKPPTQDFSLLVIPERFPAGIAGITYIDSVKLWTTPEPSTSALIGVGLAGLVARRNRKRI